MRVGFFKIPGAQGTYEKDWFFFVKKRRFFNSQNSDFFFFLISGRGEFFRPRRESRVLNSAGGRTTEEGGTVADGSLRMYKCWKGRENLKLQNLLKKRPFIPRFSQIYMH